MLRTNQQRLGACGKSVVNLKEYQIKDIEK